MRFKVFLETRLNPSMRGVGNISRDIRCGCVGVMAVRFAYRLSPVTPISRYDWISEKAVKGIICTFFLAECRSRLKICGKCNNIEDTRLTYEVSIDLETLFVS
jgi:hypothetical protein